MGVSDSLCMALYVYVPLREHISRTTRPNYANFVRLWLSPSLAALRYFRVCFVVFTFFNSWYLHERLSAYKAVTTTTTRHLTRTLAADLTIITDTQQTYSSTPHYLITSKSLCIARYYAIYQSFVLSLHLGIEFSASLACSLTLNYWLRLNLIIIC